MEIRKKYCDFCKKEVPLTSEEYEFPYLGERTINIPTYVKVNLCPICISELKNLYKQISSKIND